jgi:hypothetical protein
MRVLLAGLAFALAATGSSHAGQGEADAVQPPGNSALDEPLDLQGCSACT